MSTEAKADINVTLAVPFFWVRDLAASLAFYVDALGFTLKNQWVDEGRLRWCGLELGGAVLMLQEFWKEGPNRNEPEGPVGVGVSVAFLCRDALAVYREVRARGVTLKRPYVGNGMWVVEVTDPDGYNLFFESRTDVPEDTVLADPVAVS